MFVFKKLIHGPLTKVRGAHGSGVCVPDSFGHPPLNLFCLRFHSVNLKPLEGTVWEDNNIA